MISITFGMADKKDTGFQSGAGLIRYFDEEEINGPSIHPIVVIAIAIVLAIVVELFKVFWPIHA
jgi:preprotein translocase subunit Sec61beta